MDCALHPGQKLGSRLSTVTVQACSRHSTLTTFKPAAGDHVIDVFIASCCRTPSQDAPGCSAAGWLASFLYAAAQSGEGTLGFTHSHVEYATSYKILRGAEVDKILSILMVTAILALSLRRARDLLANSVTEEIAAAGFGRFFAPEIAEELRRSHVELASGQGVRRTAAILSIELRGFTTLWQDVSAAELIDLQASGFCGPLISETPEPQAASANTSAGDKFLDLGLKDQTTKFAEQRLRFRQRQAQLLCRKPHHPTFKPANLDRLHPPQPLRALSLSTHSMTASHLWNRRSSRSTLR